MFKIIEIWKMLYVLKVKIWIELFVDKYQLLH